VFTGLIQELGTVRSFRDGRLLIDSNLSTPDDPLRIGESVAVNGCCLTTIVGGGLEFELSPETLIRTSFGPLRNGVKVNLERAMKPTDRFGGHIVQGHVDAVGEVVTILRDGEYTVFRFRGPAIYDKYLIDKGSISVDGVSLTVVNPLEGEFDVWVIPHTMEQTNLHERVASDLVNLEYDVIAKHVEKLLDRR